MIGPWHQAAAPVVGHCLGHRLLDASHKRQFEVSPVKGHQGDKRVWFDLLRMDRCPIHSRATRDGTFRHRLPLAVIRLGCALVQRSEILRWKR